MTKLTATLLAILIALVLPLTGCSGGKRADPAALEGTWVLESLFGKTDLTPADPGVTTEITLDSGTASGTGGVNQFSATYEGSDDGGLRFGPITSTKMAGPANAMTQENRFLEALAATRTFELKEGKLVLSDMGNNTVAALSGK